MTSNNFFLLVSVLLCFFCVSSAQEDKFLKAFPHADPETFRKLPPSVLESKTNYVEPNYAVADCPAISVPADTNNVNNLRPGNIKVVMAMGDSITAAMSAKDTNILSLKEYRGLSYSIGGDTGVTTMPNLLKAYSPAGYPIGPSSGIGERDSSGNGLNAAVSGAINIDLLEQAQWLVEALQANTAIDYNNDWKLLTIWIGNNNLCDVCDDESNNDADNFAQYTTEAIEYIYLNVPRVFVNLVVNLDITQLYNINSGACGLLHAFACPCVGSSSSNDRNKVLDANIEYQLKAYSIASYFAAKNSTQFAVIVQPFLEQSLVTERSELSAADCFHPSAISHQAASIALWNNMVSPATQKQHAWSFDDTPICASADTLLYTY